MTFDNTEFKKEFWNRLMNAMFRNGITAYNLAEAIDSNPKSIYAYQRGAHDPSLSMTVRMAQQLHVSLEWLALGEEEKIKIKLESGAIPPKAAHIGDAYDIFANENKVINPYSVEKIKTGVHMEIPVGMFGDMRSRSSMFLKGMSVEGTIDPQYRGEIMVLARNNSDHEIVVRRGDRVAQMALVKCEPMAVFEVVDELDDTDRGNGGFGSTGK